VFLVSTIVLMVTLWPHREPGVVADLRSPECREWREMPAAVFPVEVPQPTEQCYSMRSFLYRQHVTVRSEDEYDRYLTLAGTKTALTCLGYWAGFSAGLYVLAWASGWAVRVLLKQSGRKDK
jgi:hypothetical protein